MRSKIFDLGIVSVEQKLNTLSLLTIMGVNINGLTLLLCG